MAATINRDHLETRVGKVETGLDMLTRDVASLAQVVREQGVNIERNLRELTIGVTQASAPRKTDWQTLIALIMLIMAIGSAVFWPLNQTASDNKEATARLEQKVDAHALLSLHPVGEAVMNRMEQRLNKLEANNEERNKADLDELRALRLRSFLNSWDESCK